MFRQEAVQANIEPVTNSDVCSHVLKRCTCLYQRKAVRMRSTEEVIVVRVIAIQQLARRLPSLMQCFESSLC
jgi:hypothetical protein